MSFEGYYQIIDQNCQYHCIDVYEPIPDNIHGWCLFNVVDETNGIDYETGDGLPLEVIANPDNNTQYWAKDSSEWHIVFIEKRDIKNV